MDRQYKKIPEKISPSTISSMSDCEFKLASERLIKGAPKPPETPAKVFGTVIHLFHVRFWEFLLGNGKPCDESMIGYGIKYLMDVFEKIHGADGEASLPKEIKWLSAWERNKLERFSPDKREVEERKLIKEKMGKYIGSARPILTAIRLETTKLLQNDEKVHVEFNIGSHGVKAEIDGFHLIELSGRIDRIHEFPDFINFVDLKTGYSYLNVLRNKLVRDIQMTAYQYAIEKIFKKKVRKIFMQSAMASADQVREFAERTLAQPFLRFPVDLRNDPIHFRNLAQIAYDVKSVMEMVINAGRYSDKQKNDWQPCSNWGQMADFKSNVLQCRFIPRIGKWCENCDFQDFCQANNVSDWEAFYNSLEIGGETLRAPELTGSDAGDSEVVIEGQLPLIEIHGKKFKKTSESLSSEKRRMVASEGFQTIKKILASIRKIPGAIPDRPLCPCKKIGLIPLPLMEHWQAYNRSEMTFQEWLNKCPHPDCPHKNTN